MQVISNHVEPFAEKLIKSGAKYDIKDPEGKTPSDWAKERGQGELFDQLILRKQAKSFDRYGPKRLKPFDQVSVAPLIV